MAVGAGGPAGGAHKGDGLSLGDLVALLDQKFGAVGVIGGKAVAVVNFDQVAVGAFGSGPDHLAAGRGGDGGAAGGGDVQPPVEILPAENLPPAEGGGDPAAEGPEEPALCPLHALGGAHGHLGGGCLRQPVSGHVLPALLLAHGVGDPVCPLLQARGALGEDLLLPQQEGAVLHLLDRGLHRLGIGDFLSLRHQSKYYYTWASS